MRIGIVVVAVVAVVASAGCSEFRQFEDSGRLELFAAAPPETWWFGSEPVAQSYAAEAPIHVGFDDGGCLPCHTSEVAIGCDARIESDRVVFSSHVQYVVTSNPIFESCTMECRSVTATCVTPALPAGTWTFVYGTHSQTVTIPSESAAPIAFGETE